MEVPTSLNYIPVPPTLEFVDNKSCIMATYIFMLLLSVLHCQMLPVVPQDFLYNSVTNFLSAFPCKLRHSWKCAFKGVHFHYNTSKLLFRLDTSLNIQITTLCAKNSSFLPHQVLRLASLSNQNWQSGDNFDMIFQLAKFT